MRSLVHLANLFYLASYFSGNVVRLRLFAVAGGVFLMAYFGLRPDPILPAVYWNAFFVVMNAYKLMQLRRINARLRQRQDVPHAEAQAHQTAPFIVTRMVDPHVSFDSGPHVRGQTWSNVRAGQ